MARSLLPGWSEMQHVLAGKAFERHAEPFGRQPEPVAERLPNQTVFLVPTSARVNRPRQKGEATDASQTAHQQHIFHQRDIRKATKVLEHRPPQKDALIAKSNPRRADSQRIAEFNQPEAASRRIKPVPEDSAGNSR